jgi:hypothetical protein
MEQQNHELLGLIVAQQRAICDKLRTQEKKEEDRIARRQQAFAETCIPDVWESVKKLDLDVPHFLYDREELNIPLDRFGNYIRHGEAIVGIKMRRRGGGEATWKCRLTKDGQIKYVGDLVDVDDGLQINQTLTKQQFEQTFIKHMAGIIPVDKLAHIQPVGSLEKKGRRRVVAMAE